MTLCVKWMGIDMGECLMDVTPRRSHLLTGDTSKALGQPEKSEARCHKWRVMVEKYGSLPVLAEDLAARGISPQEAVMMGDKEWADITPAKQRGFKTILYTGYICRGPTEADLIIDYFGDLKESIRYRDQGR